MDRSGSVKVKQYRNQVFSKLKKTCMSEGHLFEDHYVFSSECVQFPAKKYGDVVWQRPKQICDEPRLFSKDPSHCDLAQGTLKNSWFGTIYSCLVSNEGLLDRLIPDRNSQEWNSEQPDNYQGIFKFQFWRYGEWVEVVVDDLLPTVNNQLIFSHSKNRNEFWPVLLEKAYAKLLTDYNYLEKVELSDALDDFTGGVTETLDMAKMNLAFESKEEERASLFARMQEEMGRKSLMASSIPVRTLYLPNLELSTTEDAIIARFEEVVKKADCIQKVEKLGDCAFVLFKLREDALKALKALHHRSLDVDMNIVEVVMAEHEYDYNTKQAQAKPLSQAMPAEETKDSPEVETEKGLDPSTEMGLVTGHAYNITALKTISLEGSPLFDTFKRDRLPMIRLRNPSGKGKWKGTFSNRSPEWDVTSKSDRDKLGLSLETDGEFWMTFDDFCKYFCELCICRLMNADPTKTWYEESIHGRWDFPGRAGGSREGRKSSLDEDKTLMNPQYRFDVSEDQDEVLVQLLQEIVDFMGDRVTIGFTIYKVEVNRVYRIHNLSLQEVESSVDFKNCRSRLLRFGPVKEGRYAIIPTTFTPHQVNSFVLRVFTSSKNRLRELKHDAPGKSLYQYLGMKKGVTHVRVTRGEEFETQDTPEGSKLHCTLSCGFSKARLPACPGNTSNPEWNSCAVFYTNSRSGGLVDIEVWNGKACVGKFSNFLVGCFGQTSKTTLHKRGQPGRLSVEVTYNDDLLAI